MSELVECPKCDGTGSLWKRSSAVRSTQESNKWGNAPCDLCDATGKCRPEDAAALILERLDEEDPTAQLERDLRVIQAKYEHEHD